MVSKTTPNWKVYSFEEIIRIVAPIADEMGIERIYLFGSYARGEATPESDVDVVVESERIDSYLGIGRLYVRLNRALEKDVDIVHSDAGDSFMDSIRDEMVQSMVHENSGSVSKERHPVPRQDVCSITIAEGSDVFDIQTVEPGVPLPHRICTRCP